MSLKLMILRIRSRNNSHFCWRMRFAESRHDQRGHSFIELLALIGMVAILSAVSLPIILPVLRQNEADQAQQMVTNSLHLARQRAVDQRRIHRVTLDTSGTILLEKQEIPGNNWIEVFRLALPGQTEFRVEAGLPTAATQTPEGLGAASAVDFGGANTILFRPDGSTVDSLGNPTNGIVYLARPSELETARAVSLFGATGRIKKWRFSNGQWQD